MNGSVNIYDQEYKSRSATEDWMMPSENLVRALKLCGLNRPLKNNSKALDFGCGDGRHSEWLIKEGFGVCSTDVSAEAVKASRIRLDSLGLLSKADLRQIENIQEISYFKKEFDLIVAWELLHWLGTKQKWQSFFDEALKNLFLEGAIVFTMPTENHFLLPNAKLVNKCYVINDQVNFFDKSEKTQEVSLYAPPLQKMKNYFKSLGLKQLYLARFEHGREGSKASLEVRSGYYVFVLCKA